MSRTLHSHYDAIYLSPHLDDVALSCGGQIFQRTAVGEAILIVTVMAGDPPRAAISSYAQSLHQRWELAFEAVAGRRAEDVAACGLLGADPLHWELPDCIYRHDPRTGSAYYRSDAEIFGEIRAGEHALVDELAARLSALPACDSVCAPLGAGHHVDHLLTRAAVERACEPSVIRYYADYPYAQEEAALARALAPTRDDLEAIVIPLSDAALEAKITAIAAYASQLSTFWRDRQALVDQVTAFAQRAGGEQLWRRMSRHPSQRERNGIK